MFRTIPLILPVVVIVGAFAVGERPATPIPGTTREKIRFARDIRPLLSDRCFQCHGPDRETRKAELRLDLREEAVRDLGGFAAIVPGDASASELMARIISDDPDEMMPPSSSHKPCLSPEEASLLRAWIEAGAEYEPHWAFVPPSRPDLPAGGAANPIDRFLDARLAAEKIVPSPEADPSTLLRRLFLDVTGLPPTPQELDEFLSRGAGHYEAWVDRVLTREPYLTRGAEHAASAWLDAARYADTIGIHTDAGRQIWPYRDWVLRAFRDNMPFDQFITEQLAGDLLPDATTDQKVATGFNRCHVMTDEGGAIAEEYLVEYAVDRVSTTSSVFLGLTVGCARCHDHKFDPITIDDFYSLTAFFNSVEEPGLYSQLPDPNRAFEPFLDVPTPSQRAALDAIAEKAASARAALEGSAPGDEAGVSAFVDSVLSRAAVAWYRPAVERAESAGGADASVDDSGSISFTGTNPAKDDYTLKFRGVKPGTRLLLVEAMPDPTTGRAGRAPNGNAVVTGITLGETNAAGERREIPLIWAWADHSQLNGDHDITNVLSADHDDGWALDAHQRTGGRVALLLAGESFGDARGDSELTVTIRQRSIYAQHTLARVRVHCSSLSDAGADMLPIAASRWRTAGPFTVGPEEDPYARTVGPEEGVMLDLTRNFGQGNQYWKFAPEAADGKLIALSGGANVSYVGKNIFSPTARPLAASLGSDDGVRFFIAGEMAFERRIDRSATPDQDQASGRLRAGGNGVVLKVVNSGGDGAAYFRATSTAELDGDLLAALLPEDARPSPLRDRMIRAWRTAHSPHFKELDARVTALDKERAEIQKTVPRTMVMKELEKPRETFVLKRGVYDQPDAARPVSRRVPTALGVLPADAPTDRRGLAFWLTSADNPLTARVAVNRLWERFFGIGLVKTSEDFGLQGEWPSHPELLDYLAVEFRESGWDVRHLTRLILTSAAYRRSSGTRIDLSEIDPENRLLASFPRRRLTAEQLRDQALAVSGLLVEKLGGPSVKPPQPDGLWQEVSMPASNTRVYDPGTGEDLYRRSVYTYWKRAVPPPSMSALDAPTRESCTVRRAPTNTPLQSLVLWNEEQYVESARVLAARTLHESPGASDAQHAERLFRRVTARAPEAAEVEALLRALNDFRTGFRQDPLDAARLNRVGTSPPPADIDAAELASWTMIASAVMNLHETVTQR